MEPKVEKNNHKSSTVTGLVTRILAAIYFGVLVASIFYLYALTSDRYISEAEFKISENKSSPADAGLLAAALPGLVDNVSSDSQVTTSYIASADLLFELEEQFELQKHYSSPETDFYFRLPADANKEERLEYYRDRISAHFNKDTGLTTISVDTFEPEYSKLIANHLLDKSEKFVNGVNQQIADKQFEFLHKELDRAQTNLENASQELRELQNKYEFISPEQKIASTVSAIESMSLDILKIKSEIATLVRDSPNSPRIELMRSQVRSIEDLIAVENSKLSGSEKDRLNKIAQEFEIVKNKIEFRSRLLAGAELLMEKNRSEAITNSKFFTVIQTPFIPEDSSYPKRLYSSLTIVILGTLMFIILKILTQSVMERG